MEAWKKKNDPFDRFQIPVEANAPRWCQFLYDLLLSIGILCATTALCMLLDYIGEASAYSALVYVLSVFVISRLTNGYFFGAFSSFLAVFGVNYIFTYPYFAFNFSIEGYPMTFLCFLFVSLSTSAVTTRIKQAEHIRLEAERERMRANLLRAISHDLRTPLTAIIGSANAILENDSRLQEAERKELLENIVSDAEWLIRMVENLLTITRVGAQSNPSETRLITALEAPEELVDEAVRKFKKRFPEVPVSVSVPDEMQFVPMDAMLILQVLINLLDNAAQHGKTLTKISLTVQNEETGVRFAVADDGVGIPPEKMPYLLDGYFQNTAEASSDRHRSMGIGLSVCKTIVEAHGGSLTARNRPEGGAEFLFFLPFDANAALS